MGAAVVEIKLQEIEKLRQKLNSFVLSGGDKRRLLLDLGTEIIGQTQARFDSETDPKGDKWRELTEAYKERKALKSDGGILDRKGLMLMSLNRQLQGEDTILTGSPMEYADYHQNAKKEKRRREFLGFSTDNIIELEDAVDRFMKDQIT